MSRVKYITILLSLVAASQVLADLNAIKPRPQQMGMLAVAPLIVDGSLVLVMPDNPTSVEAIVRDECVAKLTAKMGVPPVVIPFSSWNRGQVSLWVGTPARFPALIDSLENSRLPGMGMLARGEEYNLLVSDSTIYLAGFDQLGMQWGLMSLLNLISEVNGTFAVDRAYVRDWPDFPKRICTINGSVRNAEQFSYADTLANMAYDYKMDEIEWNDADGGFGGRTGYAWARALELRSRFARRGQFLTFGVDRTAKVVTTKSWQEGVPIVGMPMTVSSTGFTVGSYGVSVTNGGIETWGSNAPLGWEMYPEASYGTISRDNVNRHSGSSSVKWANMAADFPYDRTIHQRMYLGAQRFYKLKVWVKTQDFEGRLNLRVFGDPPVYSGLEHSNITVLPTADWTEIVMNFATYNHDTAALWVGPAGGSSGNMWIDDVSLECAGLMNMVRRDDTPLEVFKQPGNTVMTEGVDYMVSELSSIVYDEYVDQPLLTRVSGGGLPVGTQVKINWYTAPYYQGGRETVCFSVLGPLEYYQRQTAALDSGLAPDGFKININEVSYACMDPICTSRGMGPGQLAGWHCNQMYNIIQARVPGAPVRIYGDAFDIWVDDNRAQPVVVSPWTVGALQQLSPNIEMMAMSDYSENLDSTFAYFNAHGNDAVMAYYGNTNFAVAVNGAVVARRAPNCVGFQFYSWHLSVHNKLRDFSCLGWNFGPFFLHDPLEFETRPDSLRLMVQMWSDSFMISQPTSITSRTLNYRFLPGGNWASTVPSSLGSNRYQSVLAIPANATTAEYYFGATDHRNQTRMLPPDAPTKVFTTAIPPASGNDNVDPHKYSGVIVPRIDGQVIEWPEVVGATGYEIHWSPGGDTTRRRQTLVSTVPSGQLRFYFDPGLYQNMSPDYLLVTPICETQPAERKRIAK